jgi:hypothetical protein
VTSRQKLCTLTSINKIRCCCGGGSWLQASEHSIAQTAMRCIKSSKSKLDLKRSIARLRAVPAVVRFPVAKASSCSSISCCETRREPRNGNGPIVTIAPKEAKSRERAYRKPPCRLLSFRNTPSATNVEDASRWLCSFDARIRVSRGTRGVHLEKRQRRDTACSCYQVL